MQDKTLQIDTLRRHPSTSVGTSLPPSALRCRSSEWDAGEGGRSVSVSERLVLDILVDRNRAARLGDKS